MGYFRAKDANCTVDNHIMRQVVEDQCLQNCAPDEPIFVLRAHDITSPDVVTVASVKVRGTPETFPRSNCATAPTDGVPAGRPPARSTK